MTDQRVKKVCGTLTEMGFDILLVGRRLRDSPAMDSRPYPVRRMMLMFHYGPFFYLEFQIRLFFFMLLHRADLLVSNDLDTLLPNYLISKLKGVPLVYDSHEYFTGVPELKAHPLKQKVWKLIEKCIFPHLKDVLTVSDSIATLYEREYGVRPRVVRNVPAGIGVKNIVGRKVLGLPEEKKILILQGSGINIQRGAEEMVEAMQFVEDDILLLIVGGGDVIEILKRRVHLLLLESKIIFKPRLPYENLMQYTAAADLGLSLDKDTNINYRYSLPNKIFDYIHAGIPILVSNLPEIKKVVEKYRIGDFIPNHSPEQIAEKLKQIFSHPEWIEVWKANTKKACGELNWARESEVIKKVFRRYA